MNTTPGTNNTSKLAIQKLYAQFCKARRKSTLAKVQRFVAGAKKQALRKHALALDELAKEIDSLNGEFADAMTNAIQSIKPEQ